MSGPDSVLLALWARFMADPGNPFTIPGHKHRAATIWPALGALLHGDVPLFGGLDTVKTASSALSVSEGLGADLWQADWCRYSTGGSTHTNQALALAVGQPGDTVLVTRAAHRSTLLGLIFAGLNPVWLPSDIDPRFGVPTGLSLPALTAALHEHPEAVAVFVVEPSYVGTLSDLPAIIDAAHGHGVPVVVDQAWGPHFGFHPAYPSHALSLGADALITSAHKTLPAYSQASIALARTQLLDRDRLERGFDAAATTSPAGSILASADAARALLAHPLGGELLQRLLDIVDSARLSLRSERFLDGVQLPAPTDFPTGRFDPAKLLVLLAGTTLSGNDVERELIAGGVPVEHADQDTLIPIVTMLDDSSTVGRLCDRLSSAAATVGRRPSRATSVSPVWHTVQPAAQLSPRTAFFAPHERVAAQDAVGRVSAEVIAPYPPGIPLVVPGETLNADTLDALHIAAASGARIAYAADPSLHSFQVVCPR